MRQLGGRFVDKTIGGSCLGQRQEQKGAGQPSCLSVVWRKESLSVGSA